MKWQRGVVETREGMDYPWTATIRLEDGSVVPCGAGDLYRDFTTADLIVPGRVVYVSEAGGVSIHAPESKER